ncbi:unnamed protein product [Blepharisma stoltei]|uniref:Uncharacterized protein n=1 Tax=Blepharisma stoltei TaxID=1481888 RepID=A0AAU9I5W2_9CILI|nr:unnamed protein product [Blepharisma stoltei]
MSISLKNSLNDLRRKSIERLQNIINNNSSKNRSFLKPKFDFERRRKSVGSRNSSAGGSSEDERSNSTKGINIQLRAEIRKTLKKNDVKILTSRDLKNRPPKHPLMLKRPEIKLNDIKENYACTSKTTEPELVPSCNLNNSWRDSDQTLPTCPSDSKPSFPFPRRSRKIKILSQENFGEKYLPSAPSIFPSNKNAFQFSLVIKEHELEEFYDETKFLKAFTLDELLTNNKINSFL